MMGRTHCMVPVGIADWLGGLDPGLISVAESAEVLPDIDDINSHMGYRVTILPWISRVDGTSE